VTLCVVEPERPRLSVTVKRTVNVPVTYVWLVVWPLPDVVSPNVHDQAVIDEPGCAVEGPASKATVFPDNKNVNAAAGAPDPMPIDVGALVADCPDSSVTVSSTV